MLITIGNETKKAMKVLGIKSYPFTSSEIKANYRQLLLEFHPDHNKEGSDKTKQIILSYRAICYLAIDISEKDKEKASILAEKDNEDMFTFYEPCDSCDGKGYHINTYYVVCHYCRSKILNGGKCQSCRGTGRFQQRRSRRWVDCKDCGGTGVCPVCKGNFVKETTKKTTCFKCKGAGKIKLDLFNPAIPKGAVL